MRMEDVEVTLHIVSRKASKWCGMVSPTLHCLYLPMHPEIARNLIEVWVYHRAPGMGTLKKSITVLADVWTLTARFVVRRVNASGTVTPALQGKPKLKLKGLLEDFLTFFRFMSIYIFQCEFIGKENINCMDCILCCTCSYNRDPITMAQVGRR